MLKRLKDALADRDKIEAIIQGSATNNDGSLKVGYTAPSVDGQSNVIREAQAQAEAENPALGLHYDPFLCAQDVPYHVTPDQALVDGQTAVLTARTSFQDHIITVDLQLTDEGWLINNVTCTR